MNTAQNIIIPKKTGIFRTIFLYVGQGDATLLVVPEKENYVYVLIDCNLDKEAEGIDLIKLLKDLLDKNKLDIFINTHPHDDHLRGVKDICDKIGISEVWHSGHIPGKKHQDAYKDLKYVMDKVGKNNVYQLLGSAEENKLDGEEKLLGDINYNVLSPAEYVADEIEDEDPETRYKRIHEQCGVIRFSYGLDPGRILITGDSDLCAWEEHITNYHKDRIPSNVLRASHHGSRTFFMEKEGDEPYKNHMNEINPIYVVVSAPKKSESEHDHPHDDAMKIYKEYVDEDNLIHLGYHNKKRVCVIVEIDNEGNLETFIDDELWDTYKLKDDDGDGKNNKSTKEKLASFYPITQLDNKPMGKK
ncbi:MAG: MBL fold metallo-hydrolase [Ignavibacteriaceae bacterium]